MINIEQYRSSIGLFTVKCPSGCINKWDILKIRAALALSALLAFLSTLFRFFYRRLVKIPPQVVLRRYRSILYITLCLYYFRASNIYLFVLIFTLTLGPLMTVFSNFVTGIAILLKRTISPGLLQFRLIMQTITSI